MSWLQHQRSKRWLVQHFHRMLDPGREKALRRHLDSCSQCRAAYMTLCHAEALRGNATQARHRRLEQALFSRPEAAPRVSWMKALAGAAAAAVVAAVMLLVVPPMIETGMRIKGWGDDDPSRFVSVHPYRRRPGHELEPVEGTIYQGDSLAFAYTNHSEEGFDRLLIFGIDDRYTVYWYYPAWTRSGDNPAAIEIQRGSGIELPEEVTHEYEGTRLRVFALFTNRQELTVQRIEQLVHELRQQGAAIEEMQRFPLQGTGQHTLLLEIEGTTEKHD